MLTTTFGMDRMPRIAFPVRDEDCYGAAFRSSVVGMALIDGDGRMVRVNPALAALLGYEVIELEGRDFRSIADSEDVMADDAATDAWAGAALGSDVDPLRMERRFRRRDGTVVDAMLSVSAVRQASGPATMFVAQIEDIGARKAAERAAREETEQLALALEVLDGGPWHYDIATGQLRMSPMLTPFMCDGRLLSFAEFKERVHPDDRAEFERPSMRQGEVNRRVICFRALTSDGEYRWIRSTCKLLRDARGNPETIIGISVDITEERRRQARFQAEAESDPLTGLLNRRGLDRLAAASAARCRGVAIIDLDHFKAINDGLGHAAGDAVLREAARRIAQAVRRGDAIVRLGGDEFAVLLTDEAPCDCEALAGRLLVALEGNYRAGDEMVLISASIGVALRQDRLEGLDSLLARADQALYQAKRSGRAIWRIAA